MSRVGAINKAFRWRERYYSKPELNEGLFKDLRLNVREAAILEHFANGYDRVEIAERLDVSEKCIKWHTTKILSKLGLRSITLAVVLVYQKGFKWTIKQEKQMPKGLLLGGKKQRGFNATHT